MSRFGDILNRVTGGNGSRSGPGSDLISKGQSAPQEPTPAGISDDHLASAKELAKYFTEQREKAMRVRQVHSINWDKVTCIMRGFHYFRVRNGRVRLLRPPKDRRVVRSTVPVMEPIYRWELGRINSNQLGVTVRAPMGRGTEAFYDADRAQAIMDHWMDETNLQAFFDTSNQELLYYGGSAYYVVRDTFRKQAYLRSIPFSELFPIPFDAKNWEEQDGVQRSKLVSKQWLEQQDDLFERINGKPRDRKMADLASSMRIRVSDISSMGSSGVEPGGKFDGATATWTWMKPDELHPFGQTAFMVEDEIFAYNPTQTALPFGRLPLEPVYYIKKPDDWYPYGFLEGQIGPQLEANRQLNAIITSARDNKAFTVFNTDVIDPKDVQNEISPFVPFRDPGDSRVAPFQHFPAIVQSQEVGGVLNIVREMSRTMAGYESSIIFGQQEGRTDSGNATSLLNTNAQAPLQPVIDRIYVALKRCYPMVLDTIREVWPPEKVVRQVRPHQLGRELRIMREQIPWSRDVIMSPTPLLANGRNAMLNMLFQLKQMPRDDGKGFEITSEEFRTSLQLLNMNPPGITSTNKAEQRIVWRIGQIINDGKTPAIQPADEINTPELAMEDHDLALNLLKKAILDPGYQEYSKQVREALRMEAQFHNDRLQGIMHPDNFNVDLNDSEMIAAENQLDAAENSPETLDGTFAIGGVPVGL